MDSVEKVVSVPRKLFEDASSCSEWTRDFALAEIGRLVLEAKDDTDEAFEQLRDDRDQWRQMVGHICATIPAADVLASTDTGQKTVDYFKALQQRLAAAEKRNALVEQYAVDVVECLWGLELPGSGNTRLMKLRKALEALKPTESGASE